MYTIQGTYIKNNKEKKKNDKIIEHFNGNDYETQKSAKWNELNNRIKISDCYVAHVSPETMCKESVGEDYTQWLDDDYGGDGYKKLNERERCKRRFRNELFPHLSDENDRDCCEGIKHGYNKFYCKLKDEAKTKEFNQWVNKYVLDKVNNWTEPIRLEPLKCDATDIKNKIEEYYLTYFDGLNSLNSNGPKTTIKNIIKTKLINRHTCDILHTFEKKEDNGNVLNQGTVNRRFTFTTNSNGDRNISKMVELAFIPVPTCPPKTLDCNSDDIKTKMKEFYKTYHNNKYNISNITYSNLLPNNKCKVSYIYSGDTNGDDWRNFTFINDEKCNWKVNLMEDKPPVFLTEMEKQTGKQMQQTSQQMQQGIQQVDQSIKNQFEQKQQIQQQLQQQLLAYNASKQKAPP